MNLWRSRVPSRHSAAITVRPARADDADAVARMAKALSISDGGRASRFTAECFRRDGFGAKPRFRALVAELDGAVAGYAVFYFGYDTDTATPGVYLADLFVDPDSRRMGIGGALVAGVAAACRAEGGRWMFWSVLRNNKRARRFYRAIAPELKDVVVCAAFGSNFEKLADSAGK